MPVTTGRIESILRVADIEGLLKLGAPDDEYYAEAKEIAATLEEIPTDQLTKDKVTAVIALVWAKFFELSGADVEKRLPLFQHVANLIFSEEA